jgi:ACS family hexuronate transporter-like MFS transporter
MVRVPSLRWIIAGVLFVETFLAYLDLQELAVLAPALNRQLGIGNSEYAFITQAFLAAYTVTFLFGGVVIDRLGVRWGLGWSLLLWSLADAMHALAHTGGELAMCRLVLGLFYPGAFLAAARVVSEWYPEQERAFAYGIYVSGATFGAVVGYPMVTSLSAHWSWRAPFLVTGAAGVLLSGLWILIYRRPEEHPWITQREREHIEEGRTSQTDPTVRHPWKVISKTPVVWAVAVGRFLGDSTWMFYVVWLAKFLVDAQGLSIQEMGQLGWIPFLFADLGSIGGGWLSGWMIRRGLRTTHARIVLLTASAVCRAFTFVLAFHHSTSTLLILISGLVLCTTTWQVNLSVLLVDEFPAGAIATAAGVTTACGTFGTIFFTGAVARIVQRYGYGPVFALISILSVAAYVAVMLILRRKGKPTATGRSGEHVKSAA